MVIFIRIVAAAAIAVGGWAIWTPNVVPRWAGVILFAAGLVILGWEIYMALVERGMLPEPKISLRDACRKAYEETQHTLAGTIAERSAENTKSDVHSWYAIALTVRIGVRLYGKKPPSGKLIEIPPEEARHYRFKNEARELARFDEERPVYTELAIARGDFIRGLQELKKWSV